MRICSQHSEMAVSVPSPSRASSFQARTHSVYAPPAPSGLNQLENVLPAPCCPRALGAGADAVTAAEATAEHLCTEPPASTPHQDIGSLTWGWLQNNSQARYKCLFPGLWRGLQALRWCVPCLQGWDPSLSGRLAWSCSGGSVSTSNRRQIRTVWKHQA